MFFRKNKLHEKVEETLLKTTEMNKNAMQTEQRPFCCEIGKSIIPSHVNHAMNLRVIKKTFKHRFAYRYTNIPSKIICNLNVRVFSCFRKQLVSAVIATFW